MEKTDILAPEEEPLPVKTVLIVEDDADIADILVHALKDETPYQVIHVQDGFAALKVVRTIIPDLILLDYLLPNMDGLECVELLRAITPIEQAPIILMSANLPRRAKERKDLLFLLEKPFELDLLLLQIKQILDT
ncbi:hypothetical protein KSC_017170 [Ktedonobacter sp. SOSP1-52]|uniref:response regulator n=1 Tax=Ktedonobacter sp. SOSP1-52 TaxID=2778366 RepID=UPI00191603DB|nr:response regulator [Ktedonobacter sp. SOSP1-52]GHO62825.1 hypothetical protein KSC_017170 [Ktedonobacter sp. SOSP1-52]